MNKKMGRFAITIGITLMAALAAPHAIAQTFTSGPFTATVPTQTTDYTTTLDLPKFDSSLGTLLEVQLSMEADVFVTDSSVQNNAADPQNFTASSDGHIKLMDGATILLEPVAHSEQDYTALASGDTAAYGPFSPTNTQSATYHSGDSAFSLFDGGPGTVTLGVATKTFQSVAGGGGNITFVLNTTAGATASVTYIYSNVPEPGSFAMLGAGLIGGIFFFRKRRK